MSAGPVLLSVRQDAILRAVRRDGSIQVATVAAEMGTSQMTIRRDLAVLADHGEVDRVYGGAVLPRSRRPAPAEPGEPADRLSRPGRLSLAMLAPDKSYHFQQVTQSALAVASRLRVGLEAGPFDADAASVRARIAGLVGSGVNGLIVIPGRPLAGSPGLVHWIRSLPVPVVFVEHAPEATEGLGGLDCVTTDHKQGAHQAVEHLVELGHRRIALFAGATAVSAAVCAGFGSACRASGLPGSPPRMLSGAGAGARDVEEFCDALVASRATAFLAHPDDAAVRVARALRARGLTVPDDVAIVAQGDEFAEFDDIPLTGVASPRAALGRTAVTRLMQAVAEGRERTTQHTYLSPTLHVRASTLPRQIVSGPARTG